MEYVLQRIPIQEAGASSTDRRKVGHSGRFYLPVISCPATMRLGIPALRDDALRIVRTHRAMAVFCLSGEKHFPTLGTFEHELKLKSGRKRYPPFYYADRY